MSTHIAENTLFIKSLASQLGFMFCGISKAEFLEDEASKLDRWLKQNYQGEMHYLENHFDKRLDPRLLVPGAKSVISLAYNYFPHTNINEGKNVKIARYAWGEDYHQVIKEKLQLFMRQITGKVGAVDGRFFVDSAPVMERPWAARSGLGWIGKNSLLLNRSAGSFFFLAELILDLDLQYDGPIKDYCGSCTACMDACPTEAIPEPYTVDGSKCISYLTIELKSEIPAQMNGKSEGWAFGCDICQEVCPWNRFAKPHQELAFKPLDELQSMTLKEWNELSDEAFDKVFKKSPLKRAKIEGIRRNLKWIATKKTTP